MGDDTCRGSTGEASRTPRLLRNFTTLKRTSSIPCATLPSTKSSIVHFESLSCFLVQRSAFNKKLNRFLFTCIMGAKSRRGDATCFLRTPPHCGSRGRQSFRCHLETEKSNDHPQIPPSRELRAAHLTSALSPLLTLPRMRALEASLRTWPACGRPRQRRPRRGTSW